VAAPTLPVHLEWVAPAECPSREEEAGAIARTIGTSKLEGAVDARVVVTQVGGEFHAEVSISASGATSTRSLEGESCRAVADAAALIVALAANPDAAPTMPAATPPAPVPAPGEPAATKPAETPGPLEAVRPYFVEGSFLLDSASLPSTTYGGELAVGWSPAHFDFEIGGAFLGEASARLAATPSQGANLWLAQIGARACYGFLDAVFDVGPCLGGGVEWVVARGFGGAPDEPEDATAQAGFGSLGGRATLRISNRFTLRVVGEAVVPFVRPTFVIGGGGPVFHLPAASFRAALGAEAHF
jgi:hypothetical protein